MLLKVLISKFFKSCHYCISKDTKLISEPVHFYPKIHLILFPEAWNSTTNIAITRSEQYLTYGFILANLSTSVGVFTFIYVARGFIWVISTFVLSIAQSYQRYASSICTSKLFLGNRKKNSENILHFKVKFIQTLI